MSEYVEYLIWAMFAVGGLGVGRLTHRRKHVAPVSDTAPRPIIDVPLPTLTTWSGSGPAPFRVVTLDGEVRYEGEEGGRARRHIEALRRTDIKWHAYRKGRIWDWGPRE